MLDWLVNLLSSFKNDSTYPEKKNEKNENETEVLLERKFYWMGNRLFTGDI